MSEEEFDPETDAEVKKKEKLDWEGLADAFGEYLDSEADKPYRTVFDKWFYVMMHVGLTLITGGVWIMAWTVYVGIKFFNRIDLEDFRETVLVQEYDITEEEEEYEV